MPLELPRFRRGLAAAEVDRSLRQAVTAYDTARQCALLWFHDVLERELYRELGFASMELYATQRLGFTRNRFWQFLRLSRDLDRLPPLREAVESGRLEWTKAQQVSRVATPETAQGWVDKAELSSRRELAREIKALRRRRQEKKAGQTALDLPDTEPAASPALPSPPARLSLKLEGLDAARVDAMVEAAKKAGVIPATATREEAVLAGLELLAGGADTDGAAELRRRKSATPYRVVLYRCRACESTEVVTPAGRRPVTAGEAEIALENAVVHEGRRNRHTVPPAVRQTVLARDGHRCRAPGCRSFRFLELHHIVPRARGGSHRPANLITLCSRCHRHLHRRAGAAAHLVEPVDAGPVDPVDAGSRSAFNDSEPGGPP